MSYVLGIDLGTSAVKVSAINKKGEIASQQSSEYPLYHPQIGYSEQNPEDWVLGTTVAITRLILNNKINPEDIEGISFSGQMHGLVLLDAKNQVLRPAILWNDTRTTEECSEIIEKLGERFLEITKNKPLEGFTLPKLLWVSKNEPDIFNQTEKFVLPKDYLRYRMTGNLVMEYSDAAGTVALDINSKSWSKEIYQAFRFKDSLFPPLVESTAFVGNISSSYSTFSSLSTKTKVFAGAADNAAGAIGASILNSNIVLSSIGTSGVVLKYEKDPNVNYNGKLHFFNHAVPDKFYSMGVTLAAGHSLNWFKNTFAKDIDFDTLFKEAQLSSTGANVLLFSPYIVGERTPYADSKIRGSFIGIDSSHSLNDFVRSVLEGIVFSFKDIMNMYEGSGFDTIVSIGGGAKSALWLQIQADIFNKKVITLKNEQGPGMGAAIIAAVGLGWYESIETAAKQFIEFGKTYLPIPENYDKYEKIYKTYAQIYKQTKSISHELVHYRQEL